MQTFLPYADFAASASVLDMKRLGKQRVEAKQIYLALTQPGYGWQSHPAVKMWRDCEAALAEYGFAICQEWTARGYNDTLTPFFAERIAVGPRPPWLGNPAFHASHRSNLLRKDPTHYGIWGWTEGPELPYVWPRSDEKSGELIV